MTDVTATYFGMIQALECDFTLAADPDDSHGLDGLQLKIEQGDTRMLADIRLLQELSFGLRRGRLRIVKPAGGEARSNEK